MTARCSPAARYQQVVIGTSRSLARRPGQPALPLTACPFRFKLLCLISSLQLVPAMLQFQEQI